MLLNQGAGIGISSPIPNRLKRLTFPQHLCASGPRIISRHATAPLFGAPGQAGSDTGPQIIFRHSTAPNSSLAPSYCHSGLDPESIENSVFQNKAGYRSSHSGFRSSISCTFQARFQFLSCFSRAIASDMSSKISKYISRRTLCFFEKPLATLSRCCHARFCRSLVTPTYSVPFFRDARIYV